MIPRGNSIYGLSVAHLRNLFSAQQNRFCFLHRLVKSWYPTLMPNADTYLYQMEA